MVRQNSLSPPITPYVFVLHFDFKNASARAAEKSPGVQPTSLCPGSEWGAVFALFQGGHF